MVNKMKQMKALYGCLEEVVSDNGLQFRLQEFQLFLQEHGATWITATIYNPHENGLVEGWNKTLKKGVQAFTSMDTT